MGCNDIQILKRHALPDHPLHSGKADPELILQKLADTSHSAVSEVIDIIRLTDAVCQTIDIVDGSENIVRDNMLRYQIVYVFPDRVFQVLIAVLIHQSAENDKSNLLSDPQFFRIKIDKRLYIDHAVSEHLDILSFRPYKHGLVNASRLNLLASLKRKDFTRVGDNFTRKRVCDRHGKLMSGNSSCNGKFFIKFISAHIGKVISSWIKKQIGQQCFRAVERRGISRTKSSVNFQNRFLPRLAGILFQRIDNALIITEYFLQLLSGNSASG